MSPLVIIGSIAAILVVGWIAWDYATPDRIPDPIDPVTYPPQVREPAPGENPPIPTNETPLPAIPGLPSLSQLKTGDFDNVLHCGGPLWEDGAYDSYLAAFPQQHPVMIVHFHSLVPKERFASAMDGLKKDAAAYPNTIPFESLQYSYDTEESGKPYAYDQEVSEGLFDEELREVAQTLKGIGGPVFFRPAYEFNGWWNGYTPTAYVKAWQRTYDIFQDEGATNVIFVWTYEATGGNEPFMQFYPGDAYVDWWGLDLYGYTFNDDTVLARTHAFIQGAQTHGKPVIFPESGPHNFDIDSQSTWDEWFTPYFQLMKDYPHIKGFCYTNHDFQGKDGWENIRIDTSLLKDEWQNELNGPQYLHGN